MLCKMLTDAQVVFFLFFACEFCHALPNKQAVPALIIIAHSGFPDGRGAGRVFFV